MQTSLPEVNEWKLVVHPLFLSQLDLLITKVEELKAKAPNTYHQKSASKLLAAIRKLTLEIIPTDPTRPEYRLGETLGKENKHWFRAKFFQQYRLFFRFDSMSKVIVYTWVNDENTKRVYGKKNDAYRVFEKMLNSGNPPDDLSDLLKMSKGFDRLS